MRILTFIPPMRPIDMDTSDQLGRLASRMNDRYSTLPQLDPDTIAFQGNVATISDSDFRPIPHMDEPAAAAYVDGGNSMICRTPMFVASMNRVYCCAFRGEERLEEPAPPRVQFLTLMVNMPAGRGMEREFEIFTEGGMHGEYVPTVDSVEAAAAATSDGKEHRLHSIARGMAEWHMAAMVARRMGVGDMVVMDGSLNAWGDIEKTLMLDARNTARESGAVLCGLSKTTDLMMVSGRPLANHAMEHGPEGPWYVRLGDARGGADSDIPVTFVVKLHPASKYVYRLDVDGGALDRIGADGTERLMASLAANSSDMHIPGYPYGLVDADRFAQVRNDEAARYGAILKALLIPNVRDTLDMRSQHDMLNEVTS